MDWWILEVMTTVLLLALALWLGPFIKRFGKSYAADVFRSNPRTGKSFILLTDIAYYLIFLSYVLFTVSYEPRPGWSETVNAQQLQFETARVAGILLIIGLLHGAQPPGAAGHGPPADAEPAPRRRHVHAARSPGRLRHLGVHVDRGLAGAIVCGATVLAGMVGGATVAAAPSETAVLELDHRRPTIASPPPTRPSAISRTGSVLRLQLSGFAPGTTGVDPPVRLFRRRDRGLCGNSLPRQHRR